ncbi:Uncharacterised protein [Collinsella intestinalis]|nr:Uncharacterised protein [Collinsella intestinalis]
MRTTDTAHSSHHSSSTSSRRCSAQASITSTRSLFRRGISTSVSGSPKRALYSMTLGPSGVSMKPPYRQPRKSMPSRLAAAMVSSRMRHISACSSSVTIGTGLYTPMPPVLGPRSPSRARLWSWEVAMGRTALPSVKASSVHSGPVSISSITTVLPAAPNAPSKHSCTACRASSRVRATTTPLPAARPSAFTTTGAPCSRT